MADNVDVQGFGFRLELRQTHPLWPEMHTTIGAVKERMVDLSVPFREFQDAWFANEKLVFGAEGIPTWPELSPAYAARKSVKFPGKAIMQATGRLIDSLTSETADTVYEVSPQMLVMGTSVEYSEFHQTGGGRLPQRAHVQMLEQTFQQLAGDVFVYVVEPFARGG